MHSSNRGATPAHRPFTVLNFASGLNRKVKIVTMRSLDSGAIPPRQLGISVFGVWGLEFSLVRSTSRSALRTPPGYSLFGVLHWVLVFRLRGEPCADQV